VGPIAGLNAVAKREYPVIAPAGNRNPVVQLVACSPLLTELPRLK